MKYALAYIAAALAAHAIIILIASYATLHWQSPLEWESFERGAALAASLWFGLFGLIALAWRRGLK